MDGLAIDQLHLAPAVLQGVILLLFPPKLLLSCDLLTHRG